MIRRIKNYFKKNPLSHKQQTLLRIEQYLAEGRIPWSPGYNEYRFQSIFDVIRNKNISNSFANKKLPANYGFRLDERIVEIPWVINKLSNDSNNLLDAGSSLNFKEIVTLDKVAKKDLTIFTFDPEANNFSSKRVSYVYSDLRDLPFKENLFDEIACISTIEHVDMDNSIYGWNENNAHIDNQNKSYEYIKVVDELVRVLKNSGKLLLTFPFGKFENHGFFQQFDEEMLDGIIETLEIKGSYELTFFRYLQEGWEFCEKSDCKDIVSFNPHTGKGKLDDGAAHCRSVCCIEFTKIS